MAREFNEEDNLKIFIACNTIRALMTVSSLVEGMKHPGEGLVNVAQKTGKGSLINDLVEEKDWNNLFQNEEWLNVLEGAQNLNFLQNDQYKEHLITIAKFFPEETEGYIFVEIL